MKKYHIQTIFYFLYLNYSFYCNMCYLSITARSQIDEGRSDSVAARYAMNVKYILLTSWLRTICNLSSCTNVNKRQNSGFQCRQMAFICSYLTTDYIMTNTLELVYIRLGSYNKTYDFLVCYLCSKKSTTMCI